ncbi:hypothetical protein MMAG44476_35616 [Mycolicibacterium mageritense DSM 44476 = CIP 104973]|uniref:hypothetical protein n=1 Tax=Mycolicibacterium TaxID=1866885 RepID=UPI0010424F61|nr:MULTISPECIES: hypothetical protein [Mycolicibacterium]MCC9186995.1 hypothetical protein [Mycolicibacterium mageritense]MCV7207077.1 hypothetical protein [Mycolicibacterium canariasense]
MAGVTQSDSGSVQLIVDRDSVAMSDDTKSHRQVWALPGATSTAELLSHLATHLLPYVSGFAGWQVNQDVGDRGPGSTLGMIYTRDHLRQERYLCLGVGHRRTVADLARRAPILAVHAAYLTGEAAQPRTFSQATPASTWTGVEPVRLSGVAQNDAEHDWRLMRRLDSLINAAQTPRRAWVRQHIHTGTAVVSAELFAARSMRLVAEDLCPASMIIAARDLLGIEGRYEEVFASTTPGDAGRAIAATVFGAFEWALSQPLHRPASSERRRTYLEYLGDHGYRLSPVDQFLAGHLDLAALRTVLGAESI